MFQTSDMGLAAYLVYKNFSLKEITDDTESTRKIFHFAGKQGISLEAEVEKFNNREAEVDPLNYFGAIKNLKSRLYNR